MSLTDSEKAVAHGCEWYRKRDIADIRKTEAQSIGGGFGRKFVGKGDVDFCGDVNGKTWRLETKETHQASFPLSNWSDNQRAIMSKAFGRGCEVRLLLFFMPTWEAYSIPWPPLSSFLALPWRRSITKDMARAWGELIPCEPLTRPGQWRARFLDAKPHPMQQHALAAVEAERFAHPLELPLEEETPRRRKVLGGPVDPFGREAWERAKRKAGR